MPIYINFKTQDTENITGQTNVCKYTATRPRMRFKLIITLDKEFVMKSTSYLMKSIRTRKDNGQSLKLLLILKQQDKAQEQGGHGTGKTGNLVLTFSRQGKHREFCSDTGKNLLTQGKYLDCDYLYVYFFKFQKFLASLCSA